MSTVNGKLVKNKSYTEDEQKEAVEKIDFKMVTFSLAGKDYGIDIMKVKEIAKDYDFTYVPNTEPYVRGVYNLRGDIISIIDLRVMFNLPMEKKADKALENMLILRLDKSILGVIVDSTDKVVGISSESIQPTHPLFGDINVKYISGVVEHEGKLYIILDVERIFGRDEMPEIETAKPETKPAAGGGAGADIAGVTAEDENDLQLNFLRETLATFMKFYVTPLNEEWVRSRLQEWKQIRRDQGRDIQLKSMEEADEFLAPFFSPFTGSLFGDQYLDGMKELLPKTGSSNISAWNPGCGKGYETYSLACLLKNSYNDAMIKVWANDNDLLNVSSAPGLYFQKSEVPESMRRYLVEGKSGYQFNSEIKDSILFEYHDVLNQNPFPEVDVILARDVLSFLQPEDQERLLEEFFEKLKPNGVVIVGENETVIYGDWTEIKGGNMVAFRKQSG